MARRILIVLLLAASAGGALVAVLPPAAVRLPPPAALESPTVAGAFHVHTNRSDGSAAADEIARAARDAGLGFVVFTDHGDGTRPPEPAAYRHGVLTIDGVEISTSGGHYAVIGLPQAPYPLAGEPRDVIEDVTRLGGFGFVAHGESPRAELDWSGWNLPVGGLEWVNLDSEWRRASAGLLVRAFAGYWFRGPEAVGSILDSAAALLQRFDSLAGERRLVSIGTADAHGPWLPSYAVCFRAMSTHVELDAPLTGDAAADADALIAALAAGRHYTAIDAFAAPATLEFSAQSRSGGGTAGQGAALPEGDRVLLSAHVVGPPGAELVLLENGRVVRRTRARSMIYQAEGTRAVYRVEVRVPERPLPWIVSNPIWVGIPRSSSTGPDPEVAGRVATSRDELPADSGGDWRPDADPTSHAAVDRIESSGIRFRYALGAAEPAGQVASMVVPVPKNLSRFSRLVLDAAASRPMRALVQLVGDAGGRWSRWQRSVYLDATRRTVVIPFADMRPVASTPDRVPLETIDALVILVDTNNTAPGTTGEIIFTRIVFAR